ncbi:ABC transporter substrate-binding protein [Micromonospora zhanjiangensis]|uniref:ABC transporter substrate-binding protein n=1 Tax=Micromonospora zhanjiangensis TaxID=1522057 RepID=A0ABV8KS98_9ACTN
MSRRTSAFLTAAITAAALTLGACADNRPEPAASGDTAAAFPVTVGSVTLAKRPEKIVVLSPAATETVFAIGAGQQVTAVDDQSNYPADAPKSKLSGFQPNAEAIAEKTPDLVVISNDTNKITEQLTKLKVPVYLAAAPKTLDDAYRQVDELGRLTGHAKEATDLVTRMKGDIDKLVKDLPQRTTKPTYYYELDPTYYTVTSRTFIGSLFALAGLTNVADTAGGGDYPQLSAEALIKANPDFVFLADTKCCQQSAATVKARTGWAGISAVKGDRIVPLDDDVASRWGPRVVDLVRAIVEAVAKVPA